MKYLLTLLLALGVLALLTYLRSRRRAEPPPPALPRTPAPPPATSEGNWLVGEEGEVAGKAFHIGARSITLGRGTNNFVQLTNEDASRVHCQLRPTPKGLQITDMKSANGTFINGKRVRHHTLKEGDRIRIGNDVLVYHLKGSFGQDHGLARKAAGPAMAKETSFVDGVDWKAVISDALKAHNGNVDLAAQSINVDREAFVAMMKTLGLEA